MCKQDVRIARAAAPKNVFEGGSIPAPQKLLIADPERYSLSAAVLFVEGVGANATAFVYTLVNNKRWTLMGLTQDHPAEVLTIMDVGQALLGDIWMEVVGLDTAINFCSVADACFIDDMERIP